MKKVPSNISKSFATKEKGLRGMCFADGGGASIGAAIRHGMVHGPGGPRDDKIHAKLSDGEYVLPADVVKKIGRSNLDELLEVHHSPHIDRDGDGEAGEQHAGDMVLHSLRNNAFADGGGVPPPKPVVTSLRNRGRDIDSIVDGSQTTPEPAAPAPATPVTTAPVAAAPAPAPAPVPAKPALPQESLLSRVRRAINFADGGPVQPRSTVATLRSRGRDIDSIVDGAQAAPAAPPAAPPAAAPIVQPETAPPPVTPAPPKPQPQMPQESFLSRVRRAINFADGGEVTANADDQDRAGMQVPVLLGGEPQASLRPRPIVRMSGAPMQFAEGGAVEAGRNLVTRPNWTYWSPPEAAVESAPRTAAPVRAAPVRTVTPIGEGPRAGLRGMLSVPGALAGATAAGALDSMDTPTENYQRRLGLDPKAPTNPAAYGADLAMRSSPIVGTAYNALFPDREAAASTLHTLPARTIGAVSDAGANILDMGTSAVNAGLRATGSSQQVTPFKEFLQQEDVPGKPPVTPYKTMPGASPLRTPAATNVPVGATAPATAPVRQPQPGEYGGGLKVVDEKDADGNIIHRTITGSGAGPETRIRRMTPEERELQIRAYAPSAPRAAFPGQDVYVGDRFARGYARNDAKYYAGLDNARDIARMHNEAQMRGQDMTLYGHQLQYANAAAQQRQQAEEHMTKELGAIFTKKVTDKEGNVRDEPDHAAVADFKRHLATTIASEINQLKRVPPGNKEYEAAQRRIQMLSTRGQANVNDPHMAEYLAAYKLKQRAQEAHGLLYGKGSFRASNDLTDYMHPSTRTSAIGQKRYVFDKLGMELPVNDAAYAEGPSNWFWPDIGKIPTSEFAPALGRRDLRTQ